MWMLRLAVVVVTILTVITGTVFYVLYRSDPPGWTQTEAFLARYQSADLLEMSENLQNRIISLMGDDPPFDVLTNGAADDVTEDAVNTPPGTPHQAGDEVIHLSIHEVNAWLAVKADGWLEYEDIELPPELKSPRIWTEDGRLVLGVRLASPEVDRTVSVRFDVKVVDDGLLRIRLESVRAGRLWVPHRAVSSHLRKLTDRNEENENLDHFDQLTRGLVFNPAEYVPLLRSYQLRTIDVETDGLIVHLTPRRSPG